MIIEQHTAAAAAPTSPVGGAPTWPARRDADWVCRGAAAATAAAAAVCCPMIIYIYIVDISFYKLYPLYICIYIHIYIYTLIALCFRFLLKLQKHIFKYVHIQEATLNLIQTFKIPTNNKNTPKISKYIFENPAFSKIHISKN